ALIHDLPHYYFFQRQLMFVVLALVCSVFIRFVPFSWIRRMVVPLLVLCLVLMLMTLFTHFGQEKLGSKRWLEIGPLPSLQPSELVKIGSILFLASYYKKDRSGQGTIKPMIIPFFVVMVFTLLILMQKDYSTTILYLGICVTLFLVGGMKISYLLLMLAFLAVPGVAVMLSEPYRVKRVFSFIFSNLDPSGINYQVTNSLKAIGEGGMFGVGLGNGVYKLGLIPEVQSDFIFASVCEEIGFVGAGFILVLFSMLAILGYNTYYRMLNRDRFLSYTAFGITTMILAQAFVNIAVVTGLLPPTGIPLPFFSQGGTNLFVILCCCALLYRIMLISSGRILLEKSKLPKKERQEILFPQEQEMS
ncbi:MAG: putative peptidoglycan glycosyltransferase FtsW, partial [Sphaerochaeta sp.]|nr:putative peptidoglycan glycosyltransferase FtsW [Sphaerochaeta sp.]